MVERVKHEGPLDGETTSRFPRGGRLLGPLFGLVFLIYPIRAVLTSDPTPVRVVLALGGAALFAGVFLWLMWTQEPLWSASVESSEVRKRRATIVLLAVLAIALNLILGSEWRVLFFHLNVAAGIMLLTRDAYVAIAGLAVITFGLGMVSGMAWLALPTAAIGLWATAFVRQVAAVAELRSAREELARMAVAEERLRFARDLHDLIGHSLSLIALKSELARRLAEVDPARAKAEMADVEEAARRALAEVRDAVSGYRQVSCAQALAEARSALSAAGITLRAPSGLPTLPGPVDAVLGWVVREATTNVLRHSDARTVTVELAATDDDAALTVTDDGRGPAGGTGSGLAGLAERVAALGGRLDAGASS